MVKVLKCFICDDEMKNWRNVIWYPLGQNTHHPFCSQDCLQIVVEYRGLDAFRKITSEWYEFIEAKLKQRHGGKYGYYLNQTVSQSETI